MKRVILSAEHDTKINDVVFKGVRYKYEPGYATDVIYKCKVENDFGNVYVTISDGSYYVDYGDEWIAKYATKEEAFGFANVLVKETQNHRDDDADEFESWLQSSIDKFHPSASFWEENRW